MPLAVFTVVWWVWDYQIPVRWWQEAASTSQRWEDHELEPKSRLYLQKCSSKPARTLHRASLLPADTRLISSPVLWGTTCLLSETNISDFASHFFCFCAKVTPMALLPYWKKVFPPSTQITPDILQMCVSWSCSFLSASSECQHLISNGSQVDVSFVCSQFTLCSSAEELGMHIGMHIWTRCCDVSAWERGCCCRMKSCLVAELF